ncbi:MAG: Gfo/Idh/MocA family oxidoreductase [Chloroflexota bacterium]
MTSPHQGLPIRFGVLGLGHGSQHVLRELQQHPCIKVVAGADLRQEALDQFAQQFGGATYHSVEDLCRSADVDAVYIMTPNHLHAQHTIIAADHGKQVITTKPVALTLEDADAIIASGERNGVRILAGTTPAFAPGIQKMAEIVAEGELGELLMINTWHFIEWLYRPRMPEELDPRRGGGVVFRQATHQADILRVIGGGMVRSVRAKTSIADPSRPVEGGYTAHLEFEGGASATMVFSGYAHYDDSELNYGTGERGWPRDPNTNLNARRRLRALDRPEDESTLKDSFRFGGSGNDTDPIHQTRVGVHPGEPRHSLFGVTIVSCARGDIRQTPTGLKVFGDDAWSDIPLPPASVARPRTRELDLMYNAWAADRPLPAHDARWGKGTLEVCLAILQSSRERREVFLEHQSPYQTAWH